MTYKMYRIIRPIVWIGMISFCLLFWLVIIGAL